MVIQTIKMTTANFKFETPKFRTAIYGKVTLTDEGKVSVSMPGYNRYNSSPAQRYQAKMLANEIVKADFNHPSASNVQRMGAADNSLVAALTEKTQDLKIRFIDATKKAARRMFDNKVEQNKRTLIEWFDAYSIAYDLDDSTRHEIHPFPVSYNKDYYKMVDAIKNCKAVVAAGYEKFEAMEVKYAERHYRQSIEKLAYRLKQKGVTDSSQFEITNEWIGVNLHLTIKHGNEITRAWTIIAEGLIQRAHYRYLIK